MSSKLIDTTALAQDENDRFRTHWVKTLDRELNYTLLDQAIEQVYEDFNRQAKEEASVIASVVQTVQIYQGLNGPRMFLIVTAQRLRIKDLEEQQRRARLAGGGGRGGFN